MEPLLLSHKMSIVRETTTLYREVALTTALEELKTGIMPKAPTGSPQLNRSNTNKHRSSYRKSESRDGVNYRTRRQSDTILMRKRSQRRMQKFCKEKRSTNTLRIRLNSLNSKNKRVALYMNGSNRRTILFRRESSENKLDATTTKFSDQGLLEVAH